MFRSVVSLCLVLVTSGAVLAQDEDPAKWRAFVPYVRAMTDCAARAIRTNPAALEMAAQGQWDDAIKTAQGCQAESTQMISAHDQIYGPGTGMQFGRSPYRQDLPRALSVRLRPDFEARQVRLQQEAEERRRFVEAAKQSEAAGRKLLQEATKSHDECLWGEVVSLVPYSNEPADTLVTVILAKYAEHEARRADLAVVTFSITKQEAWQLVGRVMDDTRKDRLSAIVTIRAEAVKERSERKPVSPPATGLPAVGGGKVY